MGAQRPRAAKGMDAGAGLTSAAGEAFSGAMESEEEELTTKITKGTKKKLEFDPLSNRVIGCGIEVHRYLGPGLLESTYEHCLAAELAMAGIPFVLRAPLPVIYKGRMVECGYRVDLFVDGRLIVEIKSVEALAPIHEAQLLTYMKLANVPLGLLLNFNVQLLKDGIRRFVL